MDCTIYLAKTKALISCAVTALISCAVDQHLCFAFKNRFSHDVANISLQMSVSFLPKIIKHFMLLEKIAFYN